MITVLSVLLFVTVAALQRAGPCAGAPGQWRIRLSRRRRPARPGTRSSPGSRRTPAAWGGGSGSTATGRRNTPSCSVWSARTTASRPSAIWRRMAKSGGQAMPNPCSARAISGSIVFATAVAGSAISPRSGQGSRLAAGGEAVLQAGMAGQVLRHQRHAAAPEIVGARPPAAAGTRPGSGSSAGIADLAGADHRIEALLDHVDQPVGEVEVQLDLGIGPHEGAEGRHHQHAGQRQS